MTFSNSPTELEKSLDKKVYEKSWLCKGEVTLCLERNKTLLLLAPSGHARLESFEGEAEAFGDTLILKRCPPNRANAAALRELLPNLAPVPLGLQTSAGFGDRLGMATPGHARALERVGGNIAPIFAQQSIREMTRTSRTPADVLTDATWGAFQAGWRGGVGADADHLKTTEDIDACAAAGFSFYTVDPGEFANDAAETADAAALRESFDDLPWDALETTLTDFMNRYQGKIDLETHSLDLTPEAVTRAAVKYGAAVAHVVKMYRHLASKNIPFELEVSVDETAHPTSAVEHAVIASELKRLSVAWVSLAPRYVGRFEKGVDYIGSLDELQRNLTVHAEIARALGPYKLSLHSGSDKFGVYPLVNEATRGLVHLKTAGTSYLEALRVVARVAPELFRAVLELSRARFEHDRKSYLLSCNPAKVPSAAALKDEDLPGLLEQTDARQVLHVTYGSVLDAFKAELMRVLEAHEEEHYETLARHFKKHLRPFVGRGEHVRLERQSRRRHGRNRRVGRCDGARARGGGRKSRHYGKARRKSRRGRHQHPGQRR